MAEWWQWIVKLKKSNAIFLHSTFDGMKEEQLFIVSLKELGEEKVVENQKIPGSIPIQGKLKKTE